MASAEEFRQKLNELLKDYPESLKVIRCESDIDDLDFEKLLTDPEKDLKEFYKTDKALTVYISNCLKEGKEVAIQEIGKKQVVVTSAKEFFKKEI